VLIVPPASPGIPGGRSAAHPLLLRGARLPDGRIADVTVADGVIVSVGDAPGHPPPQLVDLRGYLLLPSLVEPHAHLGLTGPATADVAALAWSSAARYLAAGTTAIRVHLDVGTESGLQAVEALLEVRAGLAGILDIQIVAAVSAPLAGLAGAASRALLRQALPARVPAPRHEARSRPWRSMPPALASASTFTSTKRLAGRPSRWAA